MIECSENELEVGVCLVLWKYFRNGLCFAFFSSVSLGARRIRPLGGCLVDHSFISADMAAKAHGCEW